VRNPDGTSRNYTYNDAAGNVATSTDENGATTLFEYDAMNRLLRTIQPIVPSTCLPRIPSSSSPTTPPATG
jgi:YD repeat-containing protein